MMNENVTRLFLFIYLFVYVAWFWRDKGGGQLNVPPGRWLTAPFNLTSHMTLFLARDAVILAVQVGFLSFKSEFNSNVNDNNTKSDLY